MKTVALLLHEEGASPTTQKAAHNTLLGPKGLSRWGNEEIYFQTSSYTLVKSIASCIGLHEAVQASSDAGFLNKNRGLL